MRWLILITVPFWTSYLLRAFAWKVILGYGGVINSGLITTGIIQEPLSFLPRLASRRLLLQGLTASGACLEVSDELPLLLAAQLPFEQLLQAGRVAGLWQCRVHGSLCSSSRTASRSRRMTRLRAA